MSLSDALCVCCLFAATFVLFRGWGRPSVPPASRDVFAFQRCPWWLIGAVDVTLSAVLTYASVGLTAWAILLLPVLGLFFALPALAFVLLPFSWYLDPAGAGNPEKYFTFNDKGQQAYRRDRDRTIEAACRTRATRMTDSHATSPV